MHWKGFPRDEWRPHPWEPSRPDWMGLWAT